MTVAREIAAKDPAALRATKEGYRFSLENANAGTNKERRELSLTTKTAKTTKEGILAGNR
jgi:hypothetical protein